MLYCTSGVDSITDYNGFSPHRSREVDRVTFIYFCVSQLYKYTIFFFFFFMQTNILFTGDIIYW